jgi:hypothetical protein
VRVRFQADADLNHIIVLATLRREPRIDFQTASAAALAGLADPDVLLLAEREGRVLVTHDQSTMPRHFSDFISSHLSPDVIVVPQHLPTAAVAEELILIWHATDISEWANRLVYLPI